MHKHQIGFITMTLILLSACAAPNPASTSSASSSSPAPVNSSTASPRNGGTLTMAVWQEPENLNGELSSQTVVKDIIALSIEGLTAVNEKGERFPVLAAEIPTIENNGISADGKTITYRLRKNVKWHDGTEFSCDDLVFTWQAVTTPNNGALSVSTFKDVDAITCPDPSTVVIKFKNVRADWASVFSGLELPFPKSAGKLDGMKTWDYNRKPIGTGPFKVTEFVTGDHITLVRNENYWQAGKPYLDKVIVRFVPSSEVAVQLLKTGEVDVMWNNTEADVPAIEKMSNIQFFSSPRSGGERLILNTVKPGDPADNQIPHPILGDVRVRQAIAYGIDKQTIIGKLLNGKALPGNGELNVDPYNCTNVKPFPYDPVQAKQLLDDAGWKPGSDGIRVKDGQRLRLKYQTTTGNKLREDTQMLILENMKAIGVEFYVENQPSSLLLGSWGVGSPRKRGNFDIIMYTTNGGIDPHNQMYNLFDSKSIASPGTQGGTNDSRWNDPETDQLIEKAGGITDWSQRKGLYCQAAQRVVEGASHIYLYQRLNLHSFNTRVQGWRATPWAGPLWNAAEVWAK